MKYCINCKKEIKDNANFCIYCGSKQDEQNIDEVKQEVKQEVKLEVKPKFKWWALIIAYSILLLTLIFITIAIITNIPLEATFGFMTYLIPFGIISIISGMKTKNKFGLAWTVTLFGLVLLIILAIALLM